MLLNINQYLKVVSLGGNLRECCKTFGALLYLDPWVQSLLVVTNLGVILQGQKWRHYLHSTHSPYVATLVHIAGVHAEAERWSRKLRTKNLHIRCVSVPVNWRATIQPAAGQSRRRWCCGRQVKRYKMTSKLAVGVAHPALAISCMWSCRVLKAGRNRLHATLVIHVKSPPAYGQALAQHELNIQTHSSCSQGWDATRPVTGPYL